MIHEQPPQQVTGTLPLSFILSVTPEKTKKGSVSLLHYTYTVQLSHEINGKVDFNSYVAFSKCMR